MARPPSRGTCHQVLDSAAQPFEHLILRAQAIHGDQQATLLEPSHQWNCLGLIESQPAADRSLGVIGPSPLPHPRGRLSARTDIAVLVGIVVFGASANAAGMIAPVAAWQVEIAERLGLASLFPVTAGFLFASLLVVPVLLVGGCASLGRRFGQVAQSTPELARRFVLTLVPLGFALWLAHFVFHLIGAWSSGVHALERAAETWLGAVPGSQSGMLMGGAPEWLLPLELITLDVGLLLSLYLAWRLAQAITGSLRRALGLVFPWASLAVGLYAVSFWILLPPMQMRGTWLP